MITAEKILSFSSKDTLRRIGRIMAFVVFTAIGAQLALRLPYTPGPVTMHPLFVVLAGIVLGPRDGFYAMLSYIAVGVAGAPVFANFTFGPVILAGTTGGYLLAFPMAALMAGGICGMLGGRRPAILAGVASGTALILISGTLYLSLLTGLSFAKAAALGLTPFLAGALVKTLAAVMIAGRRK